MRNATLYKWWLLEPPHEPARPPHSWSESASFAFLLETLKTQAEIASVGRKRFPPPLRNQNALWLEYRNYLRQAINNFEAALTVPNRSACLLYYYAMLNFAKAELLDKHASSIINRPVRHGLSFSPTNANTIAGDILTVRDGIFQMLYERRTGYQIPTGTRLPIKRILGQIPEIGTQVETVGIAKCSIGGVLQLIALDEANSWPLLAIVENTPILPKTVTGHLLYRLFEQVTPHENWKDHFGISRRVDPTAFKFYESKTKVPCPHPKLININQTREITWKLRDVLGLRTTEEYDAWLAPSMYNTKMRPMPPSIARYAVTYYASSLVRYKPAMFDPQLYLEQAYVVDAIARECALPMLIDTLSALLGRDQFFYSADSMRL